MMRNRGTRCARQHVCIFDCERTRTRMHASGSGKHDAHTRDAIKHLRNTNKLDVHVWRARICSTHVFNVSSVEIHMHRTMGDRSWWSELCRVLFQVMLLWVYAPNAMSSGLIWCDYILIHMNWLAGWGVPDCLKCNRNGVGTVENAPG